MVEECLHAIADWSSLNGLSINEGKTELLHICSRFRTRSSLSPITFNKSILRPTRCAWNLGILFDNQLTLTDHINGICRAASFGLHKIGSIRRYLDQSATERLIHAFVMSRIDNCNGLLYGLSDLLLGRLQRIQNSAARLVTRTRSHESISPILHTLHWLPVKDRLIFKLLIIAYNCQHQLAPHYLQQLLQEYQPSRLLRSSTKQLLTSCYVFPNELYYNWPNSDTKVITSSLERGTIPKHIFLQGACAALHAWYTCHIINWHQYITFLPP